MATSVYSDLSWEPETSELSVNLDAVFVALENIFATDPDERFFNPNVTANLRGLLHEPLSAATAASMYAAMVDAITRWEPRASVVHSHSFVLVNEEENGYDVDFLVSVPGLGEQRSFAAFLPRTGI